MQFSPFNEAYFGKTKELLEMEKTIGKYRKKYFSMSLGSTLQGWNSDPDLVKFNRQVEDYFGFGCFSLHVFSQSAPNAFTMPIDFNYDYKGNKPLADTKRYKFNKEYDYSVICGVYSGMIFNKSFTDEEVLALILHEIGHNFNSAITDNGNGIMTRFWVSMRFCLMIMSVITSLDTNAMKDLLTNNQTFMKWASTTEKDLRAKNSIWPKALDLVFDIRDLLESVNRLSNEIMRILTLGISTLIAVGYNLVVTGMRLAMNPLNIPITAITKKVKTNSEKTADNFVTMYGYGPALTTALAKMDGAVQNENGAISGIDKIPVLGTLMHTVEEPALIICGIMDEHPSVVARTNDQIALLKRELDKEDLDPKMRNRIKQDLAVCESSMDALTDTRKGIKDPYIASRVYNKFLNWLTKADVFQSTKRDQDTRFSAYDNALK